MDARLRYFVAKYNSLSNDTTPSFVASCAAHNGRLVYVLPLPYSQKPSLCVHITEVSLHRDPKDAHLFSRIVRVLTMSAIVTLVPAIRPSGCPVFVTEMLRVIVCLNG